jgi:hypothetical protein
MSHKEMRARADERGRLADTLEPTPSGWFRVTTCEGLRLRREEWRSWAAETKIKNPNGRDGLRFFCFLEIECKHLLVFRASGDKWQVVHSWLLRAKLVSD